ncbi:MFS transporter [Bradyrhizobium sp. CCBAU 11357]|uniref:MFS transporter n=1 Tax=Bradyrhizobium sp. CCBAU 11357 TaxID=1630808 RepID=UPI0023034598|nr:MFS transporter [Bradyrhizobium sp. CCBAU 11357]
MALDAMVLTTAFAGIRIEFSSSVETLQWTVNAYNLAFAVLLLSGAALGDRFGRRRMFAGGIALFTVTGLIMQAIGLGWIAFIASPDVAYAALIAPLVIAGVGVSMAMPAAQNAILSSVSLAEMAKASGIFNMGRFLGGMFGIAALVATFSANGAMDSAAHFADGFEAAMTLAALLSLVGAWIGLLLPARKPVSTAAAPQMVSRAPGR